MRKVLSVKKGDDVYIVGNADVNYEGNNVFVSEIHPLDASPHSVWVMYDDNSGRTIHDIDEAVWTDKEFFIQVNGKKYTKSQVNQIIHEFQINGGRS